MVHTLTIEPQTNSDLFAIKKGTHEEPMKNALKEINEKQNLQMANLPLAKTGTITSHALSLNILQAMSKSFNDEEKLNKFLNKLLFARKSEEYANALVFYLLEAALKRQPLSLKLSIFIPTLPPKKHQIPLTQKKAPYSDNEKGQHNELLPYKYVNQKVMNYGDDKPFSEQNGAFVMAHGKIVFIEQPCLQYFNCLPIKTTRGTIMFDARVLKGRPVSASTAKVCGNGIPTTVSEDSVLFNNITLEIDEMFINETYKVFVNALGKTDRFDRIAVELENFLDQIGITSISLFKFLDRQANSKFTTLLGFCHLVGIGTLVDMDKGIKQIQKEAKETNGIGNYLLGLCLFYGRGFEEDAEKAFKYFEKAAEGNNVYGQSALAFCYWQGYGVVQDSNKALHYYTKAAQLTTNVDEKQPFKLEDYRQGISMARDQEKAFYLYQKKAKDGDAEGLCVLGYCFMKGIGVKINHHEAFSCYKASSEAGCVYGQFNLAICHEFGLGTKINLDEAIKCYQGAAQSGYEEANERLEQVKYKKSASCVIL